MFCCGSEQGSAGASRAIHQDRTLISFVVSSGGQPQAEGKFTEFNGQIAIDFDNPHQAGVSFEVASRSIDVGSPSLNEYLRGEQFFKAASYPVISFVSTSVEKIDADRALVTGNFFLLGVTKQISLDVQLDRKPGGGQMLAFRAIGTIDRRDFGMNAAYPVIGESVRIVVTTEVVDGP